MFNGYVWSLYHESPRGGRVIRQAFPRFARVARGSGCENWRMQLDADVPVVAGNRDIPDQQRISVDPIKLRELLTIWFEECADLPTAFRTLLDGDGLGHEWQDDETPKQTACVAFGGEKFALDVATHIGPITTAIHRSQPESFVPYYFQGRYKLLSDICQRFEIRLPRIPGKLQKRERALFYLDINRSLQEFRTRNELSPAELNAFLYDFAPACLAEEDDEELPAPQRAWFLMAGVVTEADFALLDNADQQTESLWRGHRDARRGDIAIMWCTSPREYLRSIWRIVEDGQDDPFAHWYSLVRIGRPQPVPHLKINLETAVGRAHWCVWAGGWREATTPANACKAERQSQTLDRTCQRVRSALTQRVILGGGTRVSVHEASQGNTSGQLRFPG